MQELISFYDLLALIPAVFAVILALYNWFQMRKAAKIVPNEIINYGLISSDYHGGYKLILPLIFHNDGARKGMITQVEVGFIHDEGKEIKYLDMDGKAILNEVGEDVAQRSDWDKYTELGYRMIQPTYPIVVLGDESTDVVLIASASHEDKIVPKDKDAECVIKVRYGKNKVNMITFPFRLSDDKIPDNMITWLSPSD